MTVSELIVISVVLVVVIIRSKSKKIKLLQKKLRRQSQNSTPSETVAVSVEPPKLDEIIQSQIEETKYYLLSASEDQMPFLNKRIDFLESEITAFKASHNKDAEYWGKLCDNISSIVAAPQADIDNETEQHEQTSDEPQFDSIEEETKNPDSFETIHEIQEIEDFDAIDEADFPAEFSNTETEATDSDPFSLDELSPGESEPEPEPESDSDSDSDLKHSNISQSDLSAMQTTIAEQNSELVLLKSTIDEKDSELTELSSIAEKLKESEDAHQQLNTCIESLEKENTDLQIQLDTEKLPAEEPSKEPSEEDKKTAADLVTANTELEIAQQTIDLLHQDLSTKDIQSQKLQQEVDKLQAELQEKIKERDRLLQAEHDLSTELSVFEESQDPAVLSKQIEDLTDIIVKKSEALSALQQDDEASDDIQIISEDEEDLDGKFAAEFIEDEIDGPNDEEINKQSSIDQDYLESENIEESSDNSQSESKTQITAAQLSDNMRQLLDKQSTAIDDVDVSPPVLTNNN